MEGMDFAAYGERLGRIKTALSLNEADRVPVAPFFDGVINRFTGGSYADNFYDFEKAGQGAIEFVKMYPNVDAASVPQFASGLANEIAGTRIMDWPGKPGTMVNRNSTHQINEIPFMEPEEYPELLSDYTGFMIRKYIPRAFPNLKGTQNVTFDAPIMMNTAVVAPFAAPEFQETMKLMAKIGEEDAKAFQATMKYAGIMASLGYPSMITGVCEAPYDILGDYFRCTMGIFEDILDPEVRPYVEQTVNMFADMQVKRLQYLRFVEMPFKSIFFPLHKAMDGFMDDDTFRELYWKPLKKIILAVIELDALPFIYTEGPYNTRLEYLADVPKGKVLYHIEKADMKRAKEILGKTACISGNLSISNMEFGPKESIIDQTKYLLDTCAPGGGYIFDFDGCLENAKRENLDAMFETLEMHGKY